MPPRIRHYYRELAGHATVGLVGLAIFLGGCWAAYGAWDDGKITLPSAVAAGLTPAALTAQRPPNRQDRMLIRRPLKIRVR